MKQEEEYTGNTKGGSDWDSTMNPIKFRRSGRQVGSLISQVVNKKESDKLTTIKQGQSWSG
jgi:hypothetical protein